MKSDPPREATTKAQRVEVCNQILRICASHGRRFFSHDADRLNREDNPVISRFELDQRGRIWFIDKYTGARIYTAYKYTWRGFSDGGTLRSLCDALAAYIRAEENTIPFGHFGPWQEWVCGGDPWGYGKEEMAEVRRKVVEIFNPEVAG